jgi:tetratricopeptide (TPR) repeat protein
MSLDTSVNSLLLEAYDELKNNEAEAALETLGRALKVDFEHKETLYALKCVSWWLERIKKLDALSSPYEKGDYLVSQWGAFYRFAERVAGSADFAADNCRYAIKRYVYAIAIALFDQALPAGGEEQQDPDVLFRLGRSYKGLGNYEEAAKYLKLAAGAKREDALVLAELADVNALTGETRSAKALFREAFFLDPQSIDLDSLESEMILRLIQGVAGEGRSGQETAEWIPVYGALWGVFSVKRELKPVELGKLKLSILSLENELRGGSDAFFVKPRLLNRYFRLVDYYEGIRDNQEAVAETLLKIQFIDPAIYEQYKN